MTSIAQVRAALDSGQTQSTDLVDALLRHVDDLACIEATVPRARELAAASDARRRGGSALSAVDGVPFAVKANIDVAGVPTTSGLVHVRRAAAASDAQVVDALIAAGAVPVMTTTMAPLAIGAVTQHPELGPCRSPLDRTRHAGGSSGGSGAVVGAGLVPFALGSDTLGSVRIPAAYCAAFGWLPTHGALSAAGLVPLQSDLDSIGVVAATAADLLAIATVLDLRPTNGPVAQVRRCTLTERADEAGSAAVDEVLEVLSQLGIAVGGDFALAVDPGALRRHALLLVEIQAAQTFVAERAAGIIPAPIAALLDYGVTASQEKRDRAMAEVAAFRRQVQAAMPAGTVVVLPTTPRGAPLVSDDPTDAADLTGWVNMAGLPAIAVPVGTRSVQLVGAPGSDIDLMHLAARVCDALG